MGELINGRTVEEIKSDIERCGKDGGCAGCVHLGDKGCVEWNMRNALTLIKCLEAERDAALAKVPKWISVNERLPDDFCEVLIVLHGKRVNIAWHHGKGVFEVPSGIKFYAMKDDAMLTHWMPLPEPPKEASE